MSCNPPLLKSAIEEISLPLSFSSYACTASDRGIRGFSDSYDLGRIFGHCLINCEERESTSGTSKLPKKLHNYDT
ncbi:hypothetical protein CEXT_224941 [Caerostris extrusa]|uniref:Uncharacterized protein n=1 Tax=Caerostris extrusa TaxID=172846 RepID=A0AAV4U9U2_CAEEX|nr:hypothetical protein CEXT_224941 [Caerostris extrusa]